MAEEVTVPLGMPDSAAETDDAATSLAESEAETNDSVDET